jgi:hypothetical protein
MVQFAIFLFVNTSPSVLVVMTLSTSTVEPFPPKTKVPFPYATEFSPFRAVWAQYEPGTHVEVADAFVVDCPGISINVRTVAKRIPITMSGLLGLTLMRPLSFPP